MATCRCCIFFAVRTECANSDSDRTSLSSIHAFGCMREVVYKDRDGLFANLDGAGDYDIIKCPRCQGISVNIDRSRLSGECVICAAAVTAKCYSCGPLRYRTSMSGGHGFRETYWHRACTGLMHQNESPQQKLLKVMQQACPDSANHVQPSVFWSSGLRAWAGGGGGGGTGDQRYKTYHMSLWDWEAERNTAFPPSTSPQPLGGRSRNWICI